MFFRFRFKYLTFLGFRDLPSMEQKKVAVLKPSLLLLALSIISFCKQASTHSKVTVLKYKVSKHRLRTVQRAPMAHRKWSQEQYIVKKLHLIVEYWVKLPVRMSLLKPKAYGIVIDAASRTGLHGSTNPVLLNKSTASTQRTLYYSIN